MSRLLSKLSPHIHKRSVRSFSSSMTGPYLSLSACSCPSPEGVNIGEVVLFDPAKQELLKLTDKTIPEEIISAKWIGASKGWGFYFDTQDRCVLITDFSNPWACKSNPKLFTLPPLNPVPFSQTDVVWNVAMSSCRDDDDHWVVGIKSLGDQLSFCREEETTERRFMCYTDDIGDLCIFVSKGETFCLPGIKPNSIYFIGFGIGIYDLDTRTVSRFQAPKGSLKNIVGPYWFPPSSS